MRRNAVLPVYALYCSIMCLGACAAPIRGFNDLRMRHSGMRHADVQWVSQQDSYDCGAACLAMVLQYWDCDTELERISTKYPPRSRETGYTLGELKAIARSFGLFAFVYSSSLADLNKEITKGRPVIIPVAVELGTVFSRLGKGAGKGAESPGHYVVVCGMNQASFAVMDPRRGLEVLSRGSLEEAWSRKGRACLILSR